jgi:hypothetical protein
VLLGVGAWLLPWFTVLVVASGLAYATDMQLVQAWSVALAGPAAGISQEEHWVVIEVMGEDGARHQMQCLARAGMFMTDEVMLEASELNAIAAMACERLEVTLPS